MVGVCTDDVDETSAPLMILEYMPFGDLLTFLQTHKYVAVIDTYVCVFA